MLNAFSDRLRVLAEPLGTEGKARNIRSKWPRLRLRKVAWIARAACLKASFAVAGSSVDRSDARFVEFASFDTGNVRSTRRPHGSRIRFTVEIASKTKTRADSLKRGND